MKVAKVANDHRAHIQIKILNTFTHSWQTFVYRSKPMYLLSPWFWIKNIYRRAIVIRPTRMP